MQNAATPHQNGKLQRAARKLTSELWKCDDWNLADFPVELFGFLHRWAKQNWHRDPDGGDLTGSELWGSVTSQGPLNKTKKRFSGLQNADVVSHKSGWW